MNPGPLLGNSKSNSTTVVEGQNAFWVHIRTRGSVLLKGDKWPPLVTKI